MRQVSEARAAEIAHYVRTHWGYNPVTGRITGRQGKAIGTLRKDGALQALAYTPSGRVCVLLHRAAWLLMTGAWPDHQIDHDDGSRSNNRWGNLKPATNSQNRQNLAGKTAKGVLRGCTPYYNKWKAQIKVPGEKAPRYLGLFSTQEEAHAAYCAAKAQLRPFRPVQRRG